MSIRTPADPQRLPSQGSHLQAPPGFSLQDKLIQWREALLARALGIHSQEVLNSSPVPSQFHQNPRPIAAEVKRAVNAFRAAGMDAEGMHVNYHALAGSAAYALFRKECSPGLAVFNPDLLSTREEKLAFWINLYNALIIDAVIAFRVKTSITEGKIGILKFFRRAAYNVGGFRMTPEDIEHGILRGNRGNPYLPGPQFGPHDPRRSWIVTPPDPRIHFALNCASRSCPPVGVYSPENIDAQLDLAAQNFLSQEVHVNQETHTLQLSQIFKWYQSDFGGREGVFDFILPRLSKESSNYLLDRQDRLRWKYRRYDWRLNV